MPTIEIQAIDTLFFRDGRPFEMGDDNWAEGIFPPPPSVIYGALRSAYAAQNGITDPEEIEKATKDLRITGIYLSWNEKLYLPAPLDLVFDKNYDDEHLFHLSLLQADKKLFHNYSCMFIPYFAGQAESSQGAYIDIDDIKAYYLSNQLQNLEDGIKCLNINTLYKTEPKIGNALSRETGTTVEGKLYRVGMIRPNEDFDKELFELEQLKIIVEFKNLSLYKKGLMKLGAENKIVSYEIVDKTIGNINNIDFSSEYFKIVLTTPAISQKGNILDFDNIFGDYKPEVIAAFVGKSISIGGWDIIKKEPKPMYKAIPSGSVFYIYFKEKISVNDLTNILKDRFSLSTQRANEGFGLFYIANLNINDLKLEL